MIDENIFVYNENTNSRFNNQSNKHNSELLMVHFYTSGKDISASVLTKSLDAVSFVNYLLTLNKRKELLKYKDRRLQ